MGRARTAGLETGIVDRSCSCSIELTDLFGSGQLVRIEPEGILVRQKEPYCVSREFPTCASGASGRSRAPRPGAPLASPDRHCAQANGGDRNAGASAARMIFPDVKRLAICH